MLQKLWGSDPLTELGKALGTIGTVRSKHLECGFFVQSGAASAPSEQGGGGLDNLAWCAVGKNDL